MRMQLKEGSLFRGKIWRDALQLYRYLPILVAFAVAACAPSELAKPPDHPPVVVVAPTPDSGGINQQLADAMKLVAEKNWPQAQIALQAVIGDKDFRRLPQDVQLRTLRTAGEIAFNHGQAERAYDYLVRVTASPQAGYEDWRHRLLAADKVSNIPDTVRSLTVLVQRWPDRSGELDQEHYFYIINEAKRLPHDAAYPLLQALYAAHWRLRWDIEPSETWRDLALFLLDKHQLSHAIDVSSHVTGVYTLIAMRSDRRFDAVVAANPAQFDIEAAAAREFQGFQAASEKFPRSLELKRLAVESLLIQQHYEVALAASDAILVDIRSTNYPNKLFEDYAAEQSTMLGYRAVALERLGRWDDAIEQLSAASVLNEKYGGNVDQLIDLADLYCALGRPKDAIAAIGRIVARTSPYGNMQLENGRVDAATA